jgi:hypothetical protein
VVASTVTVTDTGWHHVAATKDGASVKLYLDGIDVTGTVTDQTMSDNTLPLAIGQSSSSAFFNGTIDEVALYNMALTPSQVANHDVTGTPPPGSPTNSALPSISGTAASGETLTADSGTWVATPPVSYAYQWRRCTQTGTACADLAGATTTSYTITDTDVGATLLISVRASDASGSTTVSSARTATVAALPSVAGDPVIAAGGDIACDPTDADFNGGAGKGVRCAQRATSDLLVGKGYTAVLALGDNQYLCGGYSAYLQSYDPSWGRVKSITRPVPGNHEYLTSGGLDCDTSGNAGGYFRYFGAAAGDPTKGYYSYDIGTWHLIALNSNCLAIGGCGAGSPQETWLKNDLAMHPNACTLAYWHHPRFNTDFHGDASETAQFWQDLYDAGADVVLNGHAHAYERFAPEDPAERYDPTRGIREFVAGTGGEDFHAFTSTKTLIETQQDTTFGVLSLTLHATSYDWRFVPIAGGAYSDSGSAFCH